MSPILTSLWSDKRFSLEIVDLRMKIGQFAVGFLQSSIFNIQFEIRLLHQVCHIFLKAASISRV
jgi:hypothetical protein